MSAPRRIVVIGPESTGKTWLVEALAKHYRVPSSPEYAREYVEQHQAKLTFADVDPIGRGQQAGEERILARAAAQGTRFAILDTDLVSTLVYSRHYYGDCPSWIETAARERLADLYLLLDVEVPWVPDGHQREQPERRAELFERFRATLERFGAAVVQINGSWHERERSAREALDRFLASAPASW